MCEPGDGFVGIVHCKTYTSGLEVIDVPSGGFGTAFWGEDNLEFTLFFYDEICAAILISESMTTDDNGLFPAWDETGNTRDDNWFTKDGSVEDVSDGSVWRSPHFLQVEFCLSAICCKCGQM